jgi:hypothetical protein
LGCCRDWVYIEILLVGSEEKECVCLRETVKKRRRRRKMACALEGGLGMLSRVPCHEVQVGVLNSSAAFARKLSRVHLVKNKGKSSYGVTTVMAVTSAPKQQEAAKSTTVDVGGESARVGVLGASGYTGSEVCSFSPLFLIDEAEV